MINTCQNLKLKYLLFCCFCLPPSIHFGQTNLKWVSPVDIPIQLSGTFGEFRSNHFHAGLDIRTQGRQGLNVKSVQSGWVNRVRVSTSGYGKALYIHHYDGTTSVYAHLKKFAPKIEAYVKKKQYEKESYTLQLFPDAELLKIEAGELVGYSGNTGGSYGPHLHFELRNSNNQNPVNPMNYPLEIKDSQRPQIQNFFIYNGIHPDSKKKEYPLVKKNDSVYTTAGIQTGGKINIGLRLFDRQDLSYNKNGVYKAVVRLNGITQFETKMDQLSFNDSNYINLLIDYQEYVQNRRRIQRFISHPEQKLSFLPNATANGEMELADGKSYQILVEISDFNHNTSYVEAYLTGINTTEESEEKKNLIVPSQDYLFDFEDKSVYFPKNSFFDSVSIPIENSADELEVGEDLYPVRTPFEVRFKIKTLDSLEASQSFIAKKNSNGNFYFFSNQKKEGFWIGKSKNLGTFAISRDSIAPEIKAVNFKNEQWLSSYNFLKIKLSDEYSGIKTYRGEINGKWVLFEYEPKNNSLLLDFNDISFDTALHHLLIEAEDNAGNIGKLEMNFYRKRKSE